MTPLRQTMRAAWATIEACGSISEAELQTLRHGPSDATIIAEYIALLDRLERTARDPHLRELIRRIRGNARKLAAML